MSSIPEQFALVGPLWGRLEAALREASAPLLEPSTKADAADMINSLKVRAAQRAFSSHSFL